MMSIFLFQPFIHSSLHQRLIYIISWVMNDDEAPKVTSNKTFVRGNFLYSEDGFDYEEKHRDHHEQDKVIEGKISFGGETKKDVTERKRQHKKKHIGKSEKTVLIPIRDTPVEPVPEPIIQNQKCERATQEQFQYFQTYISLKEKERKFQSDQQLKINQFLLEQQRVRKAEEQKREHQTQSTGITLVMEKEQKQAKKRTVRIKIKKPTQLKIADAEEVNEDGQRQRPEMKELAVVKIRVLNEE